MRFLALVVVRALLLPWFASATAGETPRVIMYLTGQHPTPPPLAAVAPVTHVALAFMRSEAFVSGTRPADGWGAGFFASVSETRRQFAPGTKVMVAIGGWGNDKGFEDAARTEGGRRAWAAGVADMAGELGVDGVDVDWEYPGGNGEDYKKTPNSEREWQISAYPLLLEALRNALGPDKLISAAVPGLERDMLAFTPQTVPHIMRYVDFLNVMTYDLMNRRDDVTKHHTGVGASKASIDAYVARGAAAADLNLGLAFYVKYFQTTHCREDDDGNEKYGEEDPAIGCPTLLLEDPETGADMGRTGGFSWHDAIPETVRESFARAQAHGRYDALDGGSRYYWDAREDLWWTYDDEAVIRAKVPEVVRAKGLGGVFAWGLGEDGPEWRHFGALVDAMGKEFGEEGRDEL